MRDPLVGRRLDDRYEVVSRIARGGMATVYRAVDTRLDREVALKVMHAHLGDDPSFTSRFVREARSAARLSHPNVVQVFDQGNDADLLFLAMEYLAGRTLRQVLTERGALTPREAMSVLEPVLDALAAAHRAGIIHRDVKPENVILTDDGRIKVADFGLAKAITSASTTGVLMGTVAYLSPELVASGVADARSDVYAAGIVLFEMLTGRQPFTGDVPVQVAYRHVHEQVPPPSALVPALPRALDELVLAATAREPDDRPADAGATLELARRSRSTLPEKALDVRPVLPKAGVRPSAAFPAAGPAAGGPLDPDRTVVVVDPADRNATQALPGIRRRRLRAPRPPAPVGPPPGSRDAELAELTRRRHRRGLVGLAGVLILALVLGAGAWWFAAGPGAVQPTPSLVHLRLVEAQSSLKLRGLKWKVVEEFSAAPVQTVTRTSPSAGARVHNRGTVTLYVSKGPATVTVPKIIGLDRTQAEALLRQNFLLPAAEIHLVNDDHAPKDSVLAAVPAPGRSVPNGTKIALTVSDGPQPVTVPEVTNQGKDAAAATLGGQGFQVATTDDFSDTVPAGSVISQTPAGNSTADHGSTVTLVISQGPHLVPVPDVVGQQLKQAQQLLAQAGFQVQVNNVLGGFFGTVRSQDPAAGTQAPNGATVTLTVV